MQISNLSNYPFFIKFSTYQIVITKMSLLCRDQIVTQIGIPNCHYQIVTFITLPKFHYQIVVTKLYY